MEKYAVAALGMIYTGIAGRLVVVVFGDVCPTNHCVPLTFTKDAQPAEVLTAVDFFLSAVHYEHRYDLCSVCFRLLEDPCSLPYYTTVACERWLSVHSVM